MKDPFQNLPSFAESHGCKPVVECKRVPSIALAKEDTLRRVSPDEARGEVPQALARGAPRPPPVQARVRRRATHAFSFLRNSAIRAFTSRLTRADGSGLANGNRIVPFEVSYPLSSAAWARLIAAVIG
jgi:hypothetical protein